MPITVAQFMTPQQRAGTQGVEGLGDSRPRQAPALGGGANVSQVGGGPSLTAIQGGRETTRAGGAQARAGSGFVNVGDYLSANQRAGAAQNTQALSPLTSAARDASQAAGGLRVEHTDTSSARALEGLNRATEGLGSLNASPEWIAAQIAGGPNLGSLDETKLQTARDAIAAGRPVAEQLSDRGQIAQGISPQAQGFGAALNTQLFVGDDRAQTALSTSQQQIEDAQTLKAEIVAKQDEVNASRQADYDALVQRAGEVRGEAQEISQRHVKQVAALREAPMGLSYDEPLRQSVVPASRDYAGMDPATLGHSLGLLPQGFDLRAKGSDQQLEATFRRLTATQARARLRAIHDQAQRTEMSKEDFEREARAYMATGNREQLFGRHPLEKASEALPRISDALRQSLHNSGFNAGEYTAELMKLPPAYRTHGMAEQAHALVIDRLIDRARETGRSDIARAEALTRIVGTG